MKVGQQKRIPATRPGVKQKRHVFGGYNWVQDTITWTIAETKNSSQFIHFLEQEMVAEGGVIRINKDSGMFLAW